MRRARPLTRPRLGVIAAVLLAGPVLLGACSTGSEEIDLAGRSFTATEVRGHELVPDTDIVVSFEDGLLSAQAGCNTLAGDATWTDGVLTAGPLAMTMMACDDALSAQDQWLSDLLTSEPAISLDGDTLTIGDDDAGLTLQED